MVSRVSEDGGSFIVVSALFRDLRRRGSGTACHAGTGPEGHGGII